MAADASGRPAGAQPVRPTPARPRAAGRAALATACLAFSLVQGPAQAQILPPPGVTLTPGDERLLDARDALNRKDRARLAAAAQDLTAQNHPLAGWAAYWDLSSRLDSATNEDVAAFYQRWRGQYVEDRLRNDWLLELIKRRDWAAFAADQPRFRMADDREVACGAVLVRHLAGEDVAEAALQAWLAQRDTEEGCQAMATTLVEAGKLPESAAWLKLRLATEAGRQRSARHALSLAAPDQGAAFSDLWSNPRKILLRARAGSETANRLAALAIMRLAASDNVAAGAAFEAAPWAEALSPEWRAATWAAIARQSAFKLAPEAVSQYQRAWRAQGNASAPQWGDEALAWQVRAALRSAATPRERWTMVAQAIDAMRDADAGDGAWTYWRAQAGLALAPAGAAGDAARTQAREALARLASPFHFYGQLAQLDLNQPGGLPPVAPPPTAAERQAAERNLGLTRALRMIELGLRSEGVREWNFTQRDFRSDRELLAAAQRACDRQVWDRCINSSDRSRTEINVVQRYPTPHLDAVMQGAQAVQLDPAYVYGLVRQESRFITDVRSSVGAAGLMQLMPATARWTAKRLGMNDFRPEQVNDPTINVRLGTAYLKFVLDDFGRSMPMAAAAYNAGPNRVRRWREGATVEAAAWAEGIPFLETRDYVKKVLANTTVYGQLIRSSPETTLRQRLGDPVGPRQADQPAANTDLP